MIIESDDREALAQYNKRSGIVGAGINLVIRQVANAGLGYPKRVLPHAWLLKWLGVHEWFSPGLQSSQKTPLLLRLLL